MLDWIIPQTVEINGSKKVVKDKGKFIVYVDGVEQSGPWVFKIWSKVNLQGKRVLILGLGCGSMTSLVSGVITGVEIDPEMIALGKKYFDLSRVSILNQDAFKFILKNKKTFDLILVDLYNGSNFPKQFESEEFLQKLSQTMSKNGTVIFNRLTTKNANFELKKFLDKLAEYFKIQEVLKVDFNILIICSRGLA